MDTPPPNVADFMTPAQLVKKYPVSKSTIYEAARSGALAHYRIAAKRGARGKYLIKLADFIVWLEGNRHDATPSPSSPASSPPVPAEPFSELNPQRLAKAWKG